MSVAPSFVTTTCLQVRERLRQGQEIALLDVREEDPFAQAHPLFAANMPIGRLEADAYSRIPRRDTDVVVLDDGEGLAERAAQVLQRLGYSQVSLLETAPNAQGRASGIEAWRRSDGQLFRDVNVPSKAFGELVESVRHTPSLSTQEVLAMIERQANMVVLDARRFDEYQTMSIPSGISVPGAELVLRARALAPDPSTHIVVNCAGRTRSIIGTQSLVNAGLPNPITALRNGTIGWTLAGQTLDRGAQQRPGPLSPEQVQEAAQRARQVADQAGVGRTDWDTVQRWQSDAQRTTYCLDVRTPEDYEAGHLSGFRSAPGGQLVQETDFQAAVRGARLVLCDTDGVRANMSASWLAQMGWEVHVLPPLSPEQLSETGAMRWADAAPLAQADAIEPTTLQQWMGDATQRTAVLDFTPSASYVKAHLSGAWFVLRSQLEQALGRIPSAECYVLTDSCGRLARQAVAEVQAITGKPVFLLAGGNPAWQGAGLPMDSGEAHLASPRIDRYRRPYEGTDAPRAAMQAYLDWEFGLVEQLRLDATHGFQVLTDKGLQAAP
jgi:rhodanese-related sulfurtransferase